MKILVVILSVFLSFHLASCQHVKRVDDRLEEFNRLDDEGQRLFRQGDFVASETTFNSAAALASTMSWTDGTVMSRRNISEIYVAKKEWIIAEGILMEAKKLCQRKADCSGSQLESIFNHLVLLHTIHKKDEDKLQMILGEVMESAEKLSESRSIKTILRAYVDNMRAAGLGEAAMNLEKQIRSL